MEFTVVPAANNKFHLGHYTCSKGMLALYPSQTFCGLTYAPPRIDQHISVYQHQISHRALSTHDCEAASPIDCYPEGPVGPSTYQQKSPWLNRGEALFCWAILSVSLSQRGN
jgi:hypothetical protein